MRRGEVAASRHVVDVRHLRRMLNRMRSLGLTQPDQPLHGLPEQFTLRPEDIPDDPEDTEAGRGLPLEVMRQLCGHLDALGAGDPQARTAVELLMDTGRRPDEICKLPFDCLERDGDGEPVLIYDNRKAFRMGRRLPIAKATAALIVEQQQNVRARSARRRDRVIKALAAALRTGDDITVSGLARAARVDRSFLYRHRDLLERVHAAASTPVDEGRLAAVSRASLQVDLANAVERNTRLAARVHQLEKRLSEQLGEQAWREAGMGAPPDIDQLQRRIAFLEQELAQKRRETCRDQDQAQVAAVPPRILDGFVTATGFFLEPRQLWSFKIGSTHYA